MAQPKTFNTTTLELIAPENFDLLEAHFELYVYEVDKQTNQAYRDKKQRDRVFGETHNDIKESLGNYPYKSFVNAVVDGIKRWYIFVLIPKGKTVPELTLRKVRYPIKPEKKSFDVLWNDRQNRGNLLKLLLVAFVRGEEHTYFVGRDELFVSARPDKRSKSRQVCMKISFSVWRDRIRVIGEARSFKKVTDTNSTSESYYRTKTGDNGQLYFLQLKKSELEAQRDKGVYINKSIKSKRTSLDYLDMDNIEGSRVHILRQFISAFQEYLANYDFSVEPLQREFYEFIPRQNADIDVSKLQTIYVLDKRHHKTHKLANYLQLFLDAFTKLKDNQKMMLKGIAFQTLEEVDEEFTGVVLILQDADKKAYKKDGLLYQNPKYPDPYLQVHQDLPNMVSQFLTVNPNDSEEAKSISEYFKYPLPKADKVLGQKILVCLYQLYLKQLVQEPRSIEKLPLPCVNEYVYISKESKSKPEVLFYFGQGGIPTFLPILDEVSREQRKEIAEALGIDWDAIYGRLLNKYKPNRSNDETSVDSYQIIMGKDLCIDIEDLDERVLYETPSMLELQKERATLRPISDFMLVKHYDKLKTQIMLSLEELNSRGLVNQSKQAQGAAEKASLKRYKTFVEIDTCLEKANISELSFDQLSKSQLGKDLAKIINCLWIDENEKDEKNREKIDLKIFNKTFVDFYNRHSTPMFPTPKDDKFHLFSGIWFTTDNCYTVGASDTLQTKQPRAHLIRRFDILQGQENFDITEFLSLMSLQFVRLNQFTVLPYFFNLIDIYIDNVLEKDINGNEAEDDE